MAITLVCSYSDYRHTCTLEVSCKPRILCSSLRGKRAASVQMVSTSCNEQTTKCVDALLFRPMTDT
jgi:hypothetical protein